MYSNTATPCSYVDYPPLDEEPLSFEVVKGVKNHAKFRNIISLKQSFFSLFNIKK